MKRSRHFLMLAILCHGVSFFMFFSSSAKHAEPRGRDNKWTGLKKELNRTFSLKSVMKGVTLIRALNLWSPLHFWVAQYFPVNDKYCQNWTNHCYWKFITKYFFLLDFFTNWITPYLNHSHVAKTYRYEMDKHTE